MSKEISNSEKRLKFIEVIKKDSNLIEVKDVAAVFSGTLSLLLEKTDTFKPVKEKLTEAEYTRMLHSLCNSFLCSLYVSAAKDNDETIKRTEYINDINSDLIVGMAIKHG